ncbi:MAG: alpha/beta hydrolase [Pseudomonadota bacterium]|nr:alpha/beta hydrolase [Pseudomonadota bacterium]
MKVIDAAGVSVRVSDDSHRPALFLLRMASRDAGLWDPIWQRLEQWFRVVQFDLPMPSLAALEQPRQVFGDLASSVREVAHALGHRTYSVFGWNGGCHVALRCAAEHRAEVRHSILLAPFHTVRDARPIEKGLDFLRVMFERGDARLYASYWYLGGLSPQFSATRFNQVEAWVEQRVAADRFLQQNPERAMKWMRALRGAWLNDSELRSINASTLILAPTLNQWHAGPTIEMADSLAALIPSAELVPLDEAGSLILLEDPQRVIAPLANFLERNNNETQCA